MERKRRGCTTTPLGLCKHRFGNGGATSVFHPVLKTELPRRMIRNNLRRIHSEKIFGASSRDSSGITLWYPTFSAGGARKERTQTGEHCNGTREGYFVVVQIGCCTTTGSIPKLRTYYGVIS